MDQTPAHEIHNPDLLKLIPKNLSKIVEIGCSHGALAKAYKLINPNCQYIGIEIEESYIEVAKNYCDKCYSVDIERVDDSFFSTLCDQECWIFGDTLEHLKNPWLILNKISKIMPKNGIIIACIPNAQHWSLQVKLSIGDFRYKNKGLLDKTHLRWFTRQTIIELFDQADFRIETILPRIINEPSQNDFLPIIGQMAYIAGVDSNIAIKDSIPLQYVIKGLKK